MIESFTCICGKNFDEISKLRSHQAKCKISNEYNSEKITKKCPICNNEYIVERRSKHKTCSAACGHKLNILKRHYNLQEKYEHVCLICSKKFIGTVDAKVCSASCRNKYNSWQNLIKKYKLPLDTSYDEFMRLSEKRTYECIYCKKTFDLKKIEVDNGAKTNFCSWKCECEQRRIDTLIEKICPICGESFTVRNTSTKKTCGKKSCADKQMQLTRKERGYINGFANPSIQSKIIETNISKYGVPYYCMTKDCRDSNGKTISRNNLTFHDKLNALGIENDLEYSIGKFSFDIKAGKYLVEIDPAYTHSCTTASAFNEPKKKEYHLTKTIIASKNGFECIHCFDWEDKDNIIDIINPNKRRILARKCILKEISKNVADNFLISNHIQGTLKIQPIRLGLYFNDELVQIMTFGKPRYNKNFEYELLRLCTAKGTYIVGGSEKLFAYFLRNYEPSSIISYCDLSKFNGNVYIKLGFKYIRTSKPAIHWYNIHTHQHFTDQLLRKHGADRLIGTSYGKGYDNKQILLDNGFVGVADCGQMVYAWNKAAVPNSTSANNNLKR